jgi:hypothetical protein
MRGGGGYRTAGADWNESGLGFRTCATRGDGPLDGLESMLFCGAFGTVGEYVKEEDEGVKAGAAGLNRDFDAVLGGGFLSVILAFPAIDRHKPAKG